MSAGFINGVLNAPQNNEPSYWVGEDTDLYQYQNIQDAIDAAVADGASSSDYKNVFVTPKSANYSEAITLADGINLIGVSPTGVNEAIRIEAPLPFNTITLQSSGNSSISNIKAIAPSLRDAIRNPTPTGTIRCSLFDVFADASSGIHALYIDDFGTGNDVILNLRGGQYQGDRAISVQQNGQLDARDVPTISGTTNSLIADNVNDVFVVTCNLFGPVSVLGGTSTCNMLFGAIITDASGGVPVTITGSSSFLTAMVQFQAATNNECAKIGAGSTLTSFFCPFLALGTAPNCIAENGPGDAGTFTRADCYAIGTVTTIQGTITANTPTAL